VNQKIQASLNNVVFQETDNKWVNTVFTKKSVFL